MSRVAHSQVAEPGFDSFLDIVANLVGILVILIMVIGVRAPMLDSRPALRRSGSCLTVGVTWKPGV